MLSKRLAQLLLLRSTATATDKVRTDIVRSLGIEDCAEFKSSFNRPNLYYEVRPKKSDDDTNKQIIKFIKQHTGKSGIIYCLSRKKVEELAAILQANDIKAAPYHAGLDSETRSKTQDDFLMEELDIIVATIAFGMGIDKPIIGGDGFNGEEFVQQATAERASNIYFISGFSTTVDVSDKAKAFLEAYRAKYNEDPSTFAALAYDSVYLVANAAKGAKTSVDIKNNLAKTQNFEVLQVKQALMQIITL